MLRRKIGRGFAITAAGLCMAAMVPRSSLADDAAELRRGRTIAERFCGRCHAVGPAGDSPQQIAPPFRTLHTRYPIAMLAEALAEGIVTGHDEMPAFMFEPDEIGALLGYIDSLAPPGAPKTRVRK